MSSTPGLSIAPMDVDEAGEFASTLHDHNKVHLLMRHAGRNYPKALTQLFLRPQDSERSDVAQENLEPIQEALIDNDTLPKGAVVEGAAVRGKGKDRVVTVVYRAESGRSGRAAIAYDEVAGLEDAFTAAQAEESGAVAGVVTDEAAAAAVKAAEDAAAEAQKRADEAEQRIAELENPEPFDGYAEANATDIVALIKDGDVVAKYGTSGLDRIEEYEGKLDKPRSTILDAVAAAKQD